MLDDELVPSFYYSVVSFVVSLVVSERLTIVASLLDVYASSFLLSANVPTQLSLHDDTRRHFDSDREGIQPPLTHLPVSVLLSPVYEATD